MSTFCKLIAVMIKQNDKRTKRHREFSVNNIYLNVFGELIRLKYSFDTRYFQLSGICHVIKILFNNIFLLYSITSRKFQRLGYTQLHGNLAYWEACVPGDHMVNALYAQHSSLVPSLTTRVRCLK